MLTLWLLPVPVLSLAEEAMSVSVGMNPGNRRSGLMISIETNPMMNIGGLAGSAQSMDFTAMARKQAEMQQKMASGMSPEAMEDQYPGVTINLPFIDYGSTGSWSNVEIQTNKGKSYNPDYMRQPGSPEFLGRATITEFSRFVIAGHFSADIYSQDQTGIFVSEGTRSGWFRGSLPVMDDPRTPTEYPGPEAARMDASAVLDALRMVREGLMGGGMFSGIGDIPLTDDGPYVPPLLQNDPNIAVTDEGMCVCVCQQMAVLPPENACRIECESRGLQCADESDDPGVDALMEELSGFGLDPATTQQLYDSLKDLTPAQRAQLLEMYRGGSGGG